jgi:hypothetical protein
MDGLNLTIGGRKLLLMTTADVVDAASGTTVGAWRSESNEKDNKVRLTVDGGAESAVQAVYQFNGNNQLVAQLVGDDGTVFDPFTFVGGIEIDDQHDLQYVLVDNTGASTGKSITVYGDLSFAENTNHLSIALTGGGTAGIQGLTGVQSLQAEKNHIAAFHADDLLIFHAETDNDIPGQEDLVVIPAKIDFVGAWDIQDGSLVFHSNIKGSPESPAVSIGFAGTLKGVTAGFVYFADKGQTQAALNITGHHVFQAEHATTELAWQTSIGFTGKSFLAQVDATSTTHFATGQVLAIKGDLTLQQDDGTPLKMNLSLEASYSFDANNILVFKALITGGDQPSYDLMLQGRFHYRDLALVFTVEYTQNPTASDIKVTLGITGDRKSIIKNISLVLDISEAEAKLQLNLSFDVRLRFADGVRVKEIPAAAGTAAAIGAGVGATPPVHV